MAELEEIRLAFVDVLERSQINNRNLPPNVASAVHFTWGVSDDALQASRMTLLRQVRDFRTRFELLFPHPTAEVKKRHDEALDLLERWLDRAGKDRTIPPTV